MQCGSLPAALDKIPGVLHAHAVALLASLSPGVSGSLQHRVPYRYCRGGKGPQ